MFGLNIDVLCATTVERFKQLNAIEKKAENRFKSPFVLFVCRRLKMTDKQTMDCAYKPNPCNSLCRLFHKNTSIAFPYIIK